MPAWMTSELRELVPVPMASVASATSTSRPVRASARAIARPTTPAPMTTQSISALMGYPFFSARSPAGVRSKPPAWKTSGGSALWPQRSTSPTMMM